MIIQIQFLQHVLLPTTLVLNRGDNGSKNIQLNGQILK